MKTVDADMIMSLDPCDEWPEDRVREAVPKEITIVDLLRAAHIPAEDRLWVALHEELCTDSLMRLFACACAERALTSERDAGRDDADAWCAAWSPSGASVKDAAWYAAWSAAKAAGYAAWADEREWQCNRLAEMLEKER